VFLRAVSQRYDRVLRLLDLKLPINMRGVVGLRTKSGFRRTIKE
jgi:hypothetical protein